MTLPATPKGSWISKELKQVYGAKRWKAGKGVDLNGNGKLERNEKIATYNTNRIPGNDSKVIGDWTDWLAFYRANYKAIHAKTVRNQKSIFFWAAKFKTTNPLHIITSIESPLVKQSQVLKAYKKTWQIIARARKIPIKGSTKVKRAKAKLLAVRTAMLKSGIKIKDQHNRPLFIENMLRGGLDCDTASFVILAEAHERGWSVFGVSAPSHFFVRWDDRRTRIKFNMDSIYKFRFPKNRTYKKVYKISPQAISAGVFLKSLTLSGLISVTLSNRASEYGRLGKTKEKIRDLIQAIKLYPENTRAYKNRGNAYTELRKFTLAIKDYTKTIKLDPNDTLAYFGRGYAYKNLRKLTLAIKDYTKVISLDPKYTEAYNNRGTAYIGLRKSNLAIKDYTKTINLDPKFVLAYNNRGTTYAILRKFTLAIGDFKKAMSLLQKSNPGYSYASGQLEGAYFKRGIKRIGAKNFAGAVSDFRNVKTKSSLVLYLIKKYTPCIRNPRKCP